MKKKIPPYYGAPLINTQKYHEYAHGISGGILASALTTGDHAYYVRLAFAKIVAANILNDRKMDAREADNKAEGDTLEVAFRTRRIAEMALPDSKAVMFAEMDGNTDLIHKIKVSTVYTALWEKYLEQKRITFRNSTSMMLGQYSTPIYIGYLMGIWCKIDREPGDEDLIIFEPTAGNGNLLIAANNKATIFANEIDFVRRANICRVLQSDENRINGTRIYGCNAADLTARVYNGFEQADAVLANPPFEPIEGGKQFDGYRIDHLDWLIALNALSKMKDDGRAAIIIGGEVDMPKAGEDKSASYRKKMYPNDGFHQFGRGTAGGKKSFYNYLYKHYNVHAVHDIDGGKLYAKNGTAFNTRLILIDGRKPVPGGYAPAYDGDPDRKLIDDMEDLFRAVMGYDILPNPHESDNDEYYGVKDEEEEFDDPFNPGQWNYGDDIILGPGLPNTRAPYESETEGVDGVYHPASFLPKMDVKTPDAMDAEINKSLVKLKMKVGDVDAFVMDKLGYKTKAELSNALYAEQIDAVALAIVNDEKGRGLIVGDQTGIGKGRVAAAMIRYAVRQGVFPVFITEKEGLFTDIYRDLAGIGSGDLTPFIFNSGVKILGESGETIHESDDDEAYSLIKSGKKPPRRYDFAMATYSQFNRYVTESYLMTMTEGQRDKKRKAIKKNPETQDKGNYLLNIGEGALFVLDESHNASGEGGTSYFMADVLKAARSCLYLSATFAKTHKNMPLYAVKTSIKDSGLSNSDMEEAFKQGGATLQEIVSAKLVEDGQMIRRQRSFDGIEVNYITLDEQGAQEFGVKDMEHEHIRVSDNITEILRMINDFQKEEVDPQIAQIQAKMRNRGGWALTTIPKEGGINTVPFASRFFNLVQQMLLSVTADAVADRAITRLRQGIKPVIALANTLEGILLELAQGDEYHEGDGDEALDGGKRNKKATATIAEKEIPIGFNIILQKALASVMMFVSVDDAGKREKLVMLPSDLSAGGEARYHEIADKIKGFDEDINICSIDHIAAKIGAAGFSVAEVTGRKSRVKILPGGKKGVISPRKREKNATVFYKFNCNEYDCLILNSSGSTGASAHAVPAVYPDGKKMRADEVRQRAMIVLQPELNIATEVQKRGRINRTGQIYPPIYDYISSALPATKRLVMMLKNKLKQLDANTASDQKNSDSLLVSLDFSNKYGDELLSEKYFPNNTEAYEIDFGKPFGDMLIAEFTNKKGESKTVHRYSLFVESNFDIAAAMMRRLPLYPVKLQKSFLTEFTEQYTSRVEELIELNEYDLEIHDLELQAKTLSKKTVARGSGSSAFAGEMYLEKIEANVLSKPFTQTELNGLIQKGKGETSLAADMNAFYVRKTDQSVAEFEDIKASPRFLSRFADAFKKVEKITIILDSIWGDMTEEEIANLTEDEKNAYIANAKHRDIEYQRGEIENKVADKLKAEIREHLLLLKSEQERLDTILSNLKVGDGVLLNDGTEAVFLGYQTSPKLANPFKALKLKLAVPDYRRLIKPGCFDPRIDGIKHLRDREGLAKGWAAAVADNQTGDDGRETRFVFTGNILLAYNTYTEAGIYFKPKQQIVSFTRLSGRVEKGILLPHMKSGKLAEYEEFFERTTGGSSVFKNMGDTAKYLLKAFAKNGRVPTVASKVGGKESTAYVRIAGANDFVKISCPSLAAFGKIYKNRAVLDLVRFGEFEKHKGMGVMEATVRHENLEALLDLLTRIDAAEEYEFAFEVNRAEYQDLMIGFANDAGRLATAKTEAKTILNLIDQGLMGIPYKHLLAVSGVFSHPKIKRY